MVDRVMLAQVSIRKRRTDIFMMMIDGSLEKWKTKGKNGTLMVEKYKKPQ
jgi:hypothetical protein